MEQTGWVQCTIQ